MTDRIIQFWSDDAGQDIAEYAVMLAVILVLVVGTIRLVGSNANNVFSNVASSIQLRARFTCGSSLEQGTPAGRSTG